LNKLGYIEIIETGEIHGRFQTKILKYKITPEGYQFMRNIEDFAKLI